MKNVSLKKKKNEGKSRSQETKNPEKHCFPGL